MSQSIEIDAKSVNELDSYRMIDIRTIDEVVSLPLMEDHDHIPMDQLLNNPECIKDDEVIILVCAAGIRSGMATEWFRKRGLVKFIHSLAGSQFGMSAIIYKIKQTLTICVF